MIIAGEVSGDLHAAGLMREFGKLMPEAQFFGVGGERMAKEGCEVLFSAEKVALIGFAEVIRYLPFIRRMMKILLSECQKRKPRAILLVDYPGFNLSFASRLRRTPALHKIPILYYISPQVWAWRASRIPKIARLVDRMAVILEFEVPIYRNAGLKTDFVGHPLLEVTKPVSSNEAFRQSLGIAADDPLIAVLPGSRIQEVKRLLPIFLRAYLKLQHEFHSLKAMVGCTSSLSEDVYRTLLRSEGVKADEIPLLFGRTYDLLAHSDVALVASGTATLETAILGTPMVIAYKVSPLTYWIGRRLVKIPDIALVNIVASRRVVPEFVQADAVPERIAAELSALLKDPSRRRQMTVDLDEVRRKLGQPGTSKKVAAILHEMIADQVSRAP